MTPRTGRVGLDVEDPGRPPASRREAPNASAPARGFLSRLESS
ncbi:hypothetical protein [Streptomyces sp. NPDC002599]